MATTNFYTTNRLKLKMLLLLNNFFLMTSTKRALLIFCLYFIFINFNPNNINENLIFCMTEGSDVPDIAENKLNTLSQSSLGELIERNFDAYISDRNIIAEQKEQIDKLTMELNFKTEIYQKIKEHEYFEEILNELSDEQNDLSQNLSAVCKKYNKTFADILPDLPSLEDGASEDDNSEA